MSNYVYLSLRDVHNKLEKQFAYVTKYVHFILLEQQYYTDEILCFRVTYLWLNEISFIWPDVDENLAGGIRKSAEVLLLGLRLLRSVGFLTFQLKSCYFI